ncbi:MAG: right-handed parallel beta-helix repeat-containing protein, partial [Patescibacteria group bacterium]|nr:right-handed parallel beta-helix repeat-containing protein [Patescibacteria group bacterium]
ASPTEGQIYFRTDTKQLYVYANGKWQADRSAATVIVAASNSQNKEKADFVATGTSDQTTINAAVAALPASGGTIVLLEGTYTVSDQILLPSNTTLTGMGDATTIKVANTVSTAFYTIRENGGTAVKISNLHLDGNKSNNTAAHTGIWFLGGTDDTTEKVTVENYVGLGINIGGPATNATVNNSVIKNNGGGIVFGGTGRATNNVISGNDGRGFTFGWDYITVSGNTISGNTSAGIYGGGTGQIISSNTISSNGTYGIHFDGGTRVTIEANIVNDNASHGVFLNGNTGLVSGNTIHNNGGTGFGSGIALTNMTSSQIANNTITDTAGLGPAISIQTSTGTYLSGNIYSGTGASSIGDNATDTIYANQVDSNGHILFRGTAGVNINTATTADATAQLLVGTGAAGNKGLTIQGVAAQTGDLLQLQSSAGTVLAKFDAAGVLTVNAGSGVVANFSGRVVGANAVASNEFATLSQVTGAVSGAAGNYIANSTSLQTNGNFNIQSAAAGSVGGIIRGASSQTADLLQFSNSSGSVLSSIDSNGTFGFPSVTGNPRISAAAYSSYGSLTTDANVFSSRDIRAGVGSGNGISLESANGLNFYDQGSTLRAYGSSANSYKGLVVNTLLRVVGGAYLGPDNMSIQDHTAIASTFVLANAANKVGLAVRGQSSQTADLFQLQKSDGSVYASVGGTGNVLFQGTNNADAFRIKNGVSADLVNVNTSGNGGIAIGSGAVSGFASDFAIGSQSTANGSSSAAVGIFSSATGNQSNAFGTSANSSGFRSTSLGSATSTASGATAIGAGVFASNGANATAANSIAIGTSTSNYFAVTNNTVNSVQIGADGVLNGGNAALYVRGGGITATYTPGTVSTTIGSASVTGVGTNFSQYFIKGDRITVGAETKTVTSVGSATFLTVDTNFTAINSGVAYVILPALLKVQTATGVEKLFVNDLGNVGIGTNAPAYQFDVQGGTGIVGQFSGRVIGGNAVANNEFATLGQVTGAVSGASGNYIANGTGLQTTANFNIQSAAAGSVGGIIRGAASQTADLLQLQNSAGTVLDKFSATGGLYVPGSAGYSFNTGQHIVAMNDGFALRSIADAPILLGDSAGVSIPNSLGINGNGGTANIRALDIVSGSSQFVRYQNGADVGLGYVDKNLGQYYALQNASTIGLQIKAAASQTADLLQFQDSAGVVLTKVTAAGSLQLKGATSNSDRLTSPSASGLFNDSDGFGLDGYGRVRINPGDIANFKHSSVDASLLLGARTSSSSAVVVRGLTGQTADVAQFQTSTGTLLSGVDATGNFFLSAGQSLKVAGSTSFPASPTEGQIYFRTDNKQLYVYANGKWTAQGGGNATTVVAASNSLNKEKADYVGNGTNDDVAINAAISALPASGGSVVLLDGTYNITATIGLVSKNKINLIGQGNSTILKRMYNESAPNTGGVITINLSSYNKISNLSIDGNKATYSSVNNYGILDITASTAANNNKIDQNYIFNTGGYGVYQLGNSAGANVNNDVTNNTVSGAGADGIYAIYPLNNHFTGNTTFSNGGYGIFTNQGNSIVVSGNVSYSNTAAGFDIVSGQSTVTNNVAYSNSTVGIVNDAGYNTVSGNQSYNNTTTGIQNGNGSSYSTYVGNVIYNNGSDGIFGGTSGPIGISYIGNTISTNGGNGINLFAGNDSIISNNRISDNGGSGSSSGIVIVSNANGVRVTGNVITDTAGTGYAIDISVSNTSLNNNNYGGTGASSIRDNGTGTIYANQQDSSGNILMRGQAGVGINTTSPSASLQNAGGFVNSALVTPAAPTVTNQGTAGSTSYSYAVTAFDGLGETLASTATTTTTGNATLNGTNFNRIVPARVSGAVSYKIYRTASAGSPATTGLIGTLAGGASTFQFDDTGLAGSTALPTVNTTGNATIAGFLGLNNASPTNRLNINTVTTTNANTAVAQALIGTGSGGNTGLVVQGTGAQTADLFQAQNAGGTVITSISYNGRINSDAGFNSSTTSNGIGIQSGGSSNGFVGQFSGTDAKFNFTGNTVPGSTIDTYIKSGSDATLYGGSALVQVRTSNASHAGTAFYAPFSGSAAVILQGTASQTGDLLQVKNSANTVLTSIDAAGKLVFGPTGSQDTNLYRSAASTLKTDSSLIVGTLGSGATTLLCVDGTNKLSTCSSGGSGSGSTGAFIANSTTLQTGANFNIQSAAATSVGGIIRGAASQSADLLQLQNSAGTTMVKVDNFGGLTVNNNLYFSNTANGPSISSPNNDGSLRIATPTSGFAQDQIQLQTSALYLTRAGSFDHSNPGINGGAPSGYRVDFLNDIDHPLSDALRVRNNVTASPITTFSVRPTGATSIALTRNNEAGLTVKGAASQSADLLQLQNSTGSVLTRFDSNGGLIINMPAPAGTPSIANSTTGGTLAAGTYYYKVTALDKAGNETTPSSEATATTTGATSSLTLSNYYVAGASSYRIYRGTASNSENVYYATTNSSFTDTGAASTAGTPPTTNNARFTYLQNNGTSLGGGYAQGNGGVAIGTGASTTANYNSIAIGSNASTTNNYALALGAGSTATEFLSAAINGTANGVSSIAIGGTANGGSSVAIGSGVTTGSAANYTVALGLGTTSNIERALTFGSNGPTALFARGGLYAPGGTVSTTAGSAVVTGVGTTFTTTVIVGDRISVGAENYSVVSIASNTSLTVASNYATTNSGIGYTLNAAIFKLQDVSATPQFFVTDVGNIGIGSTNPGARLQLNARSASSIGQIIQGTSAQTADLLQLQNSAGTVLSTFTGDGSLGVGVSAPTARLQVAGGSIFQGISAPAQPTVTNIGTAGSTSYTYTVTATTATGETAAAPVRTTTTGNATLNGTNFNRISWTAVTGASGYTVYRTASGGTPSSTGYIATLSGGSTTTFDDIGTACIGNCEKTIAPTGNTSGAINAQNGVTVGASSQGFSYIYTRTAPTNVGDYVEVFRANSGVYESEQFRVEITAPGGGGFSILSKEYLISSSYNNGFNNGAIVTPLSATSGNFDVELEAIRSTTSGGYTFRIRKSQSSLAGRDITVRVDGVKTGFDITEVNGTGTSAVGSTNYSTINMAATGGGVTFGLNTNQSLAPASLLAASNVNQANAALLQNTSGTTFLQADGSNTKLTLSGSSAVNGNIKINTQLAPSSAPTITNQGTAGAVSYSYVVTAVTKDGYETTVSPTGTTATGNATLNATNFNRLSFSHVSGAYSYKVFRTASAGSPASTGLIGTVLDSSQAYNFYGNPLTFDDTGIAGGAAAPTVQSGNLFVVGTPTSADNTAQALIATDNAGRKGLVIQGVASQSASLLEVQNSSGTVIANIDASGNLTANNYKAYVLSRTMPTTVGNYVEIGNLTSTYGALSFRLSARVDTNAFSVAKQYQYTAQSGAQSGVLIPISDTGAYAPNDFVVEAVGSGVTTTLRIRRTSGATGGTADIRLDDLTSTTTFTASTATGTGAQTAYAGYTPNQVANGNTDNVYNWNGTGYSVPLFASQPTNNGGSSLASALPSLVLSRTGVNGQSYANNAEFLLSRFANSGTDSKTQLDIALTNTSEAAATKILTLRSDGSVGIGTTAPANKLGINSLTTADSLAQVGIATGSVTNKGLVIQGAASQSADLLQLQNSSGTTLTNFDSNGNLNVTGSNTGNGSINIGRSGANNATLSFTTNGSAAGSIGVFGAASSIGIRDGNGASYFATGGNLTGYNTQPLYVDSAGQVGVGTTAPAAKLQVVGGAIYNGINTPGQPTVTNIGIAGSTSYTYTVTATTATGETAAAPVRTTATGNATLDGTNFNRITWSTVLGASGYRVYRTASAGTPSGIGLIGTVVGAGTLTFDDTGSVPGITTGTSVAPTGGTSGSIQAQNGISYDANNRTFTQSFTRTVPTAVGDYVEVFKTSGGNDATNYHISIASQGGGGATSVTKEYTVGVTYSTGFGAGALVTPIATTRQVGFTGTFDFELEAVPTGADGNTIFRIRKTQSAYAGRTVTIMVDGVNGGGNLIVPISATGTSAIASTNYSSTNVASNGGSLTVGIDYNQSNPITAIGTSSVIAASNSANINALLLQNAAGTTFLQADGSNTKLTLSGSSALNGNIKINTQLAPTGTPTITNQGTAGTVSYSYVITAVTKDGYETTVSPTGTTATGNATLNGTNFNRISFTHVNGAYNYKVYRTASAGTPASTGLIGTVLDSTQTFNATGGAVNTMTFDDTGIAGGAAAPTVQSGNLLVVGTPTTADNTAQSLISTDNSARKGLVIQGAASQTADLLQLQDSSGATLGKFEASGALTVNNLGSFGSGPSGGVTTITDNPLSAFATTINVTSTTGFPAQGVLQLEANEIAKYTGVTATSFTGVTRAYYGSSSSSHGINAHVASMLLLAQVSSTTYPRFAVTSSGTAFFKTATVGDAATLSVGSSSDIPNTGSRIFYDSTGSLTLAANNLTVDLQTRGGGGILLNGGNVGIGSNNFAQGIGYDTETPLDVAGTTQLKRIANATSGATLQNSNILRLQGAYYNGASSVSVNSDIRTLASNTSGLYRLGFNVGGSERLSVLSNGNVGINNSAAGNPLSINTPTTADSLAQALIGTGSATNKGMVVQGAASQSADLFQLQNSAGTVLSTFNATGQLGIGTSTPSAQLQVVGGAIFSGISAPAQPTVANIGTAGGTSYTYCVTAKTATGETACSTVRNTATGNATLDGTNFNRITWVAINGATGYNVYRTVAAGTPSTTGKIATTTSSVVTYDDTGTAATGTSTPPSGGTSGTINAQDGVSYDTTGYTFTRAYRRTVPSTLGNYVEVFRSNSNSAASQLRIQVSYSGISKEYLTAGSYYNPTGNILTPINSNYALTGSGSLSSDEIELEVVRDSTNGVGAQVYRIRLTGGSGGGSAEVRVDGTLATGAGVTELNGTGTSAISASSVMGSNSASTGGGFTAGIRAYTGRLAEASLQAGSNVNQANALLLQNTSGTSFLTADGSNTKLNLAGSTALNGNIKINTQVAPTGTPAITNQGAAGAVSYSYVVTAITKDGYETTVSPTGTTATGNATLNGTNFNRITFAHVSGAYSYNVYRTASAGTPSSTGLIGNVLDSSQAFNTNGTSASSLTFDDTGLAGGAAAPTVQSGNLLVVGTPTTADTAAQNLISTDNAARKGLVIQGVASQSADLLQLQNSTGSVVAKISATGYVTSPGLLGAGSSGFYLDRNNAPTILGQGAGLTSLIVANQVGQTGDLLQLQNSGGTVLSRFDIAGNLNLGQMQPTTLIAATPSSSGGSMATNTYYYKVVALDAVANQTLPSNELSAAVTGPNGSVSLSWNAVTGAASYRVYRGTAAGAEDRYLSAAYTTIGTSFTDTGSTTTVVTPPTVASAYNTNLSVTNGTTSFSGNISVPGPGGTQNATEHFGYGSSIGLNSSSDLAVGSGAIIGAGVNAATAIGPGASISGGDGGTALGASASVTSANSLALGRGAAVAQAGSIALGYNVSTTAAHQLVVGSSDVNYDIRTAYFGSGVTNAAPSAFTLQGTGGSGTDIAGASVAIAGGQGTGTGAGGGLNFQIAKPAGSTGSGLNALSTVASISGANGAATFQNAANSTTAFQVQNAAGTNILTVDSTYSQLSVRGTNSDATLGAELIPTAGTNDFSTSWTTTGWTLGGGNTTATHNTGNTSQLTYTGYTPVTGTTYQVTFTYVNGNNVDTIRPIIGSSNGQNITRTGGTETQIIKAAGTGPLSFATTSTWVGTISAVSVKIVTTSNSALSVLNSSGVAALQVRASTSTTNTLIGLNAGLANISGTSLTAVGSGALQNNTTGIGNSAFGTSALTTNTTGIHNSAFGTSALQNNTTGTDNVAVGYQALQSDTTGFGNVAVGSGSLGNNNGGSGNVALGINALQFNTTGGPNIAIGPTALMSNSTGGSNIGIGSNSLRTIGTNSNSI